MKTKGLIKLRKSLSSKLDKARSDILKKEEDNKRLEQAVIDLKEKTSLLEEKTRLLEENNKRLEQEAIKLQENFRKELLAVNIRNGELVCKLKTQEKEKQKAQAEADANKPENKARNWALAFYTIVSKVLWSIVLFFVSFPRRTIEFIKQLPANTKYLTTGVWSGEITFRTTVDGCISYAIFEPLETFCFVMSIVALIYFLK